MDSIWKDIIVDAEGTPGEGEEFSVNVAGNVVYTGTCYEDVNGDFDVRINDIIADYLQHSLSYFANLPASLTNRFEVLPYFALSVIVENSQETECYNDKVVMDWSYDRGISLATATPAAPINGRIDPRMPLMRTNPFAGGPITADLYAVTGDFYIGDYNNDFSGADVHDTYTWAVTAGVNADLILAPVSVANYQWIVIGNDTYKVVRSCNRFALYYINAYGGVDFLLMEGLCTEEDALERSNVKQKYNNTKAANRGKKEYMVGITKKYTLRTGYLTDAESARMFHLLESPEVYLYDMQGLVNPSDAVMYDRMLPVVITDNSCSHKTYKSNGRRLSQYVINVELAQDRYRRG